MARVCSAPSDKTPALTLSASLSFKGVADCAPDVSTKSDSSLPHNLCLLKPSTPQLHGHVNGNRFPPGSQDVAVPRERLSDEEEEDDESEQGEDDEEEEVDEAPRRWQGIEGVFEAYQEYVDGE